MKTLLRFAEKVFTILALLLFSGAVLVLVRQKSGAANPEGDPLFQIIWFGIYGITFCLLAVQWRGFTRLPRNLDKPILLLTGVALLSYYWSDMPQLTLRRSVAMAGTTLFGIYLATRYSPREQLRLLAWTFGIGAVLSLLFAVFLPSYGLDVYPYAGSWRGVYSQKNGLGRNMTLGLFVFLLIALSSHRHRWFAWSCFGLSVGLLMLSGSKTALITFVTILILLPFYRALRWQYTASVPLFIIAILICGSLAIWFTTEAETLLRFIGKDVTLTGRTQLWEAVFTMIQQRPWLGYGYSVFWLSQDAYYGVQQVIRWPAPHAHSGLLDLWLDVGLLGVLIFALTFLNTLVKAVVFVRHAKTLEDFWPIVYLTIMFLFNLSQSSILSRNNIAWILYVAINLWQPVQHYRKPKFPLGTIPNKGGLVKDA